MAWREPARVLANTSTPTLGKSAKRLLDIALSLVAGILLSPLMLLVALCVRLDGGDVFYWQDRVGYGGKLFRCVKFRTMRREADRYLDDVLRTTPHALKEWQCFQKLRNDPRVTPMGRWLRWLSLDELPQLYNVLRGEMSLVGPRPILPEQIRLYTHGYALYIAVRPGITGPWQVGGRNNLPFSRRIEIESSYISEWSLWRDLVIMGKTIPALLRFREAC